MSIRVLVIGLGQIGMGYDSGLDPRQYVRSHARAFSLHPAFELAGGVDCEERPRKAFAAEYGRPAFLDVESALAELRPDVVVVSVPTPRHADVVDQVLRLRRPAALLCEKPLSMDLDEAQRLVDACAQRGTQLFVNYMRRSDPGAVAVRKRIESGEIGAPVKGVAWYSKGFLHNGSHFFNLLEYWLGEMKEAQLLSAGRLWDGEDPEPDVRVGFERGSVVFLAAREEQFSHYTIELVASNGRLRYDKGGHRIGWQRAQSDGTSSGRKALSEEGEAIESGMNRYQWNVAEQLALALDSRPAQLCSADEALRTLKNMTRILRQRTS